MAKAIVELWAIRKMGTDLYLPETPHGKGYSYTEPCKTSETLPRLCQTKHQALKALRSWVKGDYHWEDMKTPNQFGGFNTKLVQRPIEGRLLSEMEIVKVKVMEVYP